MNKNVIIAACISSAHALMAADTPMTWPLTLHRDRMHIGDNEIKTMKSPKPQDTKLKVTFDIKGAIPPRLYAGIWVSELVPKTSADAKAGYWQTKLVVNGREQAVLNDKVKPSRASEDQKIVVPLESKDLQLGENQLEIIPGGKGSDLDDFEVHKITLGPSRP